MSRAPHALLGLVLLVSMQSWAEEPVGDPVDETTPDAQARPPLVERSVAEAQVLEQRLEKREQQQLQAGDESFLALWLPANVGEPSGAVILLPGDVENADGAPAIGPLRRKLPDAGWHSLSLTLPDPDGDPLPLRSAVATTVETPAEDSTMPTEDEPSPEATPAGEPAASDTTEPEEHPAEPAMDPAQRREAHAQRVMARIEAAIAFAQQQQAGEIVLLGHGSGAYWAARYLSERKPEGIQNLLMVAAELPAGFAPPLDEQVAQLPVAVGDFYYKDQASERNAALKRLQASKRAKLPTYIQVAMKALPGNPQVEQEQLYRRLRGWLQLHIGANGQKNAGP